LEDSRLRPDNAPMAAPSRIDGMEASGSGSPPRASARMPSDELRHLPAIAEFLARIGLRVEWGEVSDG